MKRNSKKVLEILNELIVVNNDRIKGYERAAAETRNDDFDLKQLFRSLADNSRQYSAELRNEVIRQGGEPAQGTSPLGSLYRAWMDIRAVLSGHSAMAILQSCEYGEDAAQKAYAEALEESYDLSYNVRTMMANQRDHLRESHDLIRQYRDVQRVIRA